MENGTSFKIAVIGGDTRQRLAAEELRARGYEVSEFGVDGDMPDGDISHALEGASVAVLPLPASRDGFRVNAAAEIPFETLAEKLPKGCRVFAGRLQPALKDMLMKCGFEIFDFYNDRIFVEENNEISADGAVAYLLSVSDGDISGKAVLVCGYGGFGEALCEKLKALGTSVTVAARRDESLCRARERGVSPLKIDLAQKIFFSVPQDFYAVLNTVPYHIFTEENIGTLEGKIYLELASAPFGGVPAHLEKVARYKYLPAIPANFAPDRAGRAMLASLLRYIDNIRRDT